MSEISDHGAVEVCMAGDVHVTFGDWLIAVGR